jgi:hypothetical protein
MQLSTAAPSGAAGGFMRTILIAVTVVALAFQGKAYAVVQSEEPDPEVLIDAASDSLADANASIALAEYLISAGASDTAITSALNEAVNSVRDAEAAAGQLIDLGYQNEAGNILGLAGDAIITINLARPRST